jgi:hypothetical protein
MSMLDLRKIVSLWRRQEYPESSGYYERIPIRVGEFVLVENEKGVVVFETTESSICNNQGKIIVSIDNGNGGWSVTCTQDGISWAVVPSVDIQSRIARLRSTWHAAQYMAGNELDWKERFLLSHQVYNEQTLDLFDDDAFFENGDPVTTDPFSRFLR